MSNAARYRAVKAAVLEARGHRCEACGALSDHVHHIIPCSETGIASELVYHEANLMVLCDDCHLLMHPEDARSAVADGWAHARRIRGLAL